MSYKDGQEYQPSQKSASSEYDRTLDIDTEKYLQDPEHWDQLGEVMGVDVQTVDLNDAFVPLNKYGKENLNKTERNINRRFGIEPKAE